MRSSKIIAPLAVLVGLLAATPTAAPAAPAGHAKRGGDVVVLTYPSIMQTRLVRAQTAIRRAAAFFDDGDPGRATTALAAARTNLTKAWNGAVYVIETTPPPPPPEDKLHLGAFRRSGSLRIDRRHRRHHHRHHHHHQRPRRGDPQTGPVFATIYDTAFAVLSLQHYASTTAVGLVDEASGPLLDGVRATVTQALDERDAAIAYIASLPQPPPPEPKSPAAAKRGDPVVGSWATVMPNVVPYIDDEIQQFEGTIAAGGLPADVAEFLASGETQVSATKDTVNELWPPIPPED
jgi:hypothetical protein